jgi:hypothetical protein
VSPRERHIFSLAGHNFHDKRCWVASVAVCIKDLGPSPAVMFRKFTPEDISTQNQVKSSIQRGIRGIGIEYLPFSLSFIRLIIADLVRVCQPKYAALIQA